MFRCTHAIVASAAGLTLMMNSMSMGQDLTHTGQTPSDGTDRATMNKPVMGGNDADATMMKQLKMAQSTPDKAPDALFTMAAVEGNAFEAAFSKLVAEKSQDAQIKELATMVQKDHEMAQTKLQPIAQKMGMTIPSMLPADKQAKLAVFAALPVNKLEECYLSEMKANHLMAVSSYADHTKSAMDPDLKAYTAEVLPKLKQHTAMILKVAEAHGMPTDMNFGSTSMNGMSH